MRALITAAVSGAVFSLGLALGGMTDPTKVQGFLDLTGDWDPSLAFVMGGGLGSFALLQRLLIRRRERPVFAPAFPACPSSRLDRRLLGGSAMFGVGWGLGGFCPGPALTSVASGGSTVLLFTLSMVGGMVLFRGLEALRARAVAQVAEGAEALPAAES